MGSSSSNDLDFSAKEGTTSSSLNNILQMVETGKSLYVLLPTCTEIALDILDTLCQHQKTGPAVLEFIQLTWPGELTIGRLAQQLPLVELGLSVCFFFAEKRCII